ncbi:MAG: hypothetical protein QOE31_3634 [Solirubrobacteraceae bacterium]|nr:hypothetical protein [Solirubrobacteraceae bacterium]
MRLAPVAVALVACVAAGGASSPRTAVAQAPQPATWTAPAPILQPPPRTLLGNPAIAFAPGGTGLVTWDYELANGHTGQRAASWLADGTLARGHELREFIEPPRVYGRDRAFALVSQRSGGARRLRVAFGSTDGSFATAQTIYTSGPEAYSVVSRAAVGERGNVAVVVRSLPREGSSRIVLLERRAGGRFGAATVVQEHYVCHCYFESSVIAVAVGRRGDLAVAWARGNSIVARVRPPGGRFGPRVRLGRANAATNLELAVSPAGAVWATWFDNPRSSAEGRGPMTVRLAVRPARARRFGAARVLDRVERTWYGFGAPVQLALDPRGAGFLTWSTPAGNNPRVRLASADPRGGGVRVRTLSAPGTQAFAKVLVTSRRPGEALAVWSEIDEEHGLSHVVARRVSPDGALAPAQVVSTSGHAGAPAAAVEPVSGRAIVLWAEALPKPTPGSPTQHVLLASTLAP